MAIVNLLKASWTGKLGATVGAKWKDKNTIRTYSVPTYSDTPAQQVVRNDFRKLSQAFTMFADQLKHISALDTKGMSIRNALMHINKGAFADAVITPDELVMSKGGLPKPVNLAAALAAGTLTVTWTATPSAVISTSAQMIVIAAAEAAPGSELLFSAVSVAQAAYSLGTLAITSADLVSPIIVYAYILDKHSGAKVGSPSVNVMAT
jgi:hypothetical protein